MSRKYSRATALAAGTIILLFYGLLYAWSIYSSPFRTEFGWTSAQLGLCFTIIMISFCFGGILGSIITSKSGLNRSMFIGGALSFAGYALVYFLSGNNIFFLFLLFSLSGLGCGIIYNCVISTVVGLFPEKKGFASGVMLLGFGASTLILGTLANALIESFVGWRLTYIITGLVLLSVALAGRIFLNSECEDKFSCGDTDGLTPRQMISTADFWLLFFGTAMLSFFGQGIIGHTKSIPLEGSAGASLSTLCVGFVSVANGIGRIFFGTLNDRKGFKTALLTDSAVYIAGGVLLILALRSSSLVLLVAAFLLCGLGYGAVPPIVSSSTKEFFGSKAYAKNFSIVNLNIIIASLGSTVMGSIESSGGTYIRALIPFIAVQIIPIVLIFVLSSVRSAGGRH